MKKNVGGIRDCYGCGVCATVCGRKIINIGLNEEGFYEPYIIDEDDCTNCGICMEVCAYLHDGLSLLKTDLKPYAAWSKDHSVRHKCSSGGVGFEIGRYLLSQGYKVCGVRYNAGKNRAEHYIASTVKDLIPSIGSKYIQSYTVDAFKSINRKEKNLVIGTPCQIDSFRRYIRKFHCEENFVLLDFFCHGVPSYLLWDKYTKWAELKVGKIVYATWRSKVTGWHDSWAMEIGSQGTDDEIKLARFEQNINKEEKSCISSRWSQDDMFYNLFLGDCCLGKACYDACKFKYDRSSVDIRIGDLWGKTYQNNEEGVSAVISFTKKGDEILHSSNCEFKDHTLDIVGEGQMKTAATKTSAYSVVMRMLRDKDTSIVDCDIALKKHNRRQRNIRRLKHPISTLKEIISRIQKKII